MQIPRILKSVKKQMHGELQRCMGDIASDAVWTFWGKRHF
jgi:hypothetical protein